MVCSRALGAQRIISRLINVREMANPCEDHSLMVLTPRDRKTETYLRQEFHESQ